MLVLAPILAQVATLGVADRTEARYTNEGGLKYSSALTRPNVALALAWRRFNLTFSYGPSIMVQPLEQSNRTLYLLHAGFVTGTYSWRRTQLLVSEAGSYGSQNFSTVALNGQVNPSTTTPQPPVTGSPTPGGTTPPPTSTPPITGGMPTGPGGASVSQGTPRPAANLKIPFMTFTSSVALAHRASHSTDVIGEFSYIIAGATQESDQQLFPVVRGTRTQGTVRYRLNEADDFSLAIAAQYASSSIGTSVWLGTSTATWGHRFDVRTRGTLGAGISGSRTPLPRDFVAYSVYPVFTATLAHSTMLSRGTLNLVFAASSTPVIDPTTAVADPRVGLSAALGWTRDRFTASLTGNTTISTAATGSLGSLTSVGGSAGIAYAFTKGFSADTGVRAAFQSYQGQTVLPVSYVVFVGISFGQQTRL